MDDRPAIRRFDVAIGRWRDLAEKRRASFAELERTGRWKRYYTEAQFVLRMYQVSELAQTWAELAALTPNPTAAGRPVSVADDATATAAELPRNTL